MRTLLCFAGLLLLTASPVRSQEKTQKKTPPPRQLFGIMKDNQTGFIDRTGRIVIPPHLGEQFAPGFSEGLAPVRIKGHWCYIDETGKVVIRTNFDRVGPFTEGLASVGVTRRNPDGTETMKYGYIDRRGRLVIQPRFDETYDFSEGLGRVVVNSKWGFIDKTGNMVIEPQFTSAYWFSGGFASVGLPPDRRVYIDHSGKVVSNPEYQYTDAWFAEGLAPAARGSKWGFINREWKMEIEPQFDYTGQCFSEGLALVRVNGKLGYIDGKYGYIDRMGKMIISPRFAQHGGAFHDGRALIHVNGKYGYINRNGDIVIEPQFVMANDFSGGLAAVRTDEELRFVSRCCSDWNYIDTTGRYVWRAKR